MQGDTVILTLTDKQITEQFLQSETSVSSHTTKTEITIEQGVLKSDTDLIDSLTQKPVSEEISEIVASVQEAKKESVVQDKESTSGEQSEIRTDIKSVNEFLKAEISAIHSAVSSSEKDIKEQENIIQSSISTTLESAKTMEKDVHSKDVVTIETTKTSRPESVLSQASDISAKDEHKLSEIDDSPDKTETKKEHPGVKESRSKSVASIMVSSVYKPDELEPLSSVEEDHSKDDSQMTSASRKASDINTLIEDVKKLDDKLITSKVEIVKKEILITDDGETTTTTTTTSKSSDDPAHPETVTSTTTVTPTAKSDDKIGLVTDLLGKTSPQHQDGSSELKAAPVTQEASVSSLLKQLDSSFNPDQLNEVKQTVTTTTTITKITTDKDGTKTETVTVSSDGQASDFSDSHHILKELTASHPITSKDLAAIKSEIRSSTPGSDDFDPQDIYSPRSDISSGQASRIIAGGSDNESHQYSDDDIPTSPFSSVSKGASSPPHKFSYDLDYDLQRSGSGVSKKSDLDIDDSQDDIPPQYGSKEVESAILVSSAYKPDPMSTSFYGELPTAFEKSDPITITTVRTVVTKQYEDYQSSGPDESSSYASQESYNTRPSGDHKFLDEADLDFEKALEEHRQVRGSDVMSSVTAKYEFSPSKHTFDEATSSKEFTLENVKTTKTEEAKEETKKEEATVTTTTTTTATTTTTLTQQQVEENLKKAEERVASWGKPLGLPSPAATENSTTPKKERRLYVAKTKLNNEKNLRKRSESPIKGKKVSPIYMDLTYVPHNGNSYYSHVEFFKTVRARYYVFSGTEPSREVYNALLEAKQTWEDKDLGKEIGHIMKIIINRKNKKKL